MAACCLLGAILESRAVQFKNTEQSLCCSAGQTEVGGLEEPEYGEPSNWAHCRTVAHWCFFFSRLFSFKKI